MANFSEEKEENEQLLESGEEHLIPKRKRFTWVNLTIVIFVLLSIFNLIVAIANLATIHRSNSPDMGLQAPTSGATPSDQWKDFDCGQTVESAMARGCPFDVFSNLWTSPNCYESAFATETLDGVKVYSEGGGVGAPEFGSDTYSWFEDEDLTRPLRSADEIEHFLARQDAAGGPLEAFTHMSFHAAHCSYLARVATRGLSRVHKGETNVWVPAVVVTPEHARHCEHVFGELYRMGEDEARRNWTQVGFGIAPCVRLA